MHTIYECSKFSGSWIKALQQRRYNYCYFLVTTMEETSEMTTPSFKTELCKAHFSIGRVCNFGQNCFYAHSESELKFRTLYARANRGLIDIDTYQTRPCFSFLSTGSW